MHSFAIAAKARDGSPGRSTEGVDREEMHIDMAAADQHSAMISNGVADTRRYIAHICSETSDCDDRNEIDAVAFAWLRAHSHIKLVAGTVKKP